MNCEWVTRNIALYCYGELGPEDEEHLEQHVESCAGCRTELERQKKFMASLDGRRLESSAALLAECRHNLMREVYRREKSGWSFGWLFARLHTLRQPLGALALIVLGYFAARVTHTRPAPGTAEPVFATIRSVQPDAAGRVQIAFDETRRRVVSGRMDEGRIQQLLLTGARDESNPGVRVESIEALKDQSGSAEVRSALLIAVAGDPNPGVRLKALEGLKSFTQNADVRQTLTQVLLKDANAGVRMQAIDLLMSHRDEAIVGVLQSLVEKENNGYIRMRTQNALREMNASVGTF